MSDNSFGVNHLAIIMDGNGRWAQARGLERSAGHKAGAENVLKIMRSVKEFGIKYLTLYAFSTENWKRPAEEVGGLMKLLKEFTFNQLPAMQKEDVRLNAIGRLDALPDAARLGLLAAMKATRNNRSGVLTLALNYGGRAELVDAAVKFAQEVKAGRVAPDALDENMFEKYLYDPELPPPELVVRTSGELRISNFLLWQMAYSELYITDVLWPDFDRHELQKALESFRGRDRRFGGVKK
ncbi:MAG: isoprenyl transferase [Lentisphaerae bacterium]|nr:isoprenyl transferase [Lentisphaerota bacterium]